MMWGMMQEKVYETWITDLDKMKATEDGVVWSVIVAAIRQWHRRQVQISDVCFVHQIFSCSIPARCNQRVSSLENLEVTVNVGYFLEILSLTTQR